MKCLCNRHNKRGSGYHKNSIIQPTGLYRTYVWDLSYLNTSSVVLCDRVCTPIHMLMHNLNRDEHTAVWVQHYAVIVPNGSLDASCTNAKEVIIF
jgi:ribulose kinase